MTRSLQAATASRRATAELAACQQVDGHRWAAATQQEAAKPARGWLGLPGGLEEAESLCLHEQLTGAGFQQLKGQACRSSAAAGQPKAAESRSRLRQRGCRPAAERTEESRESPTASMKPEAARRRGLAPGSEAEAEKPEEGMKPEASRA